MCGLISWMNFSPFPPPSHHKINGPSIIIMSIRLRSDIKFGLSQNVSVPLPSVSWRKRTSNSLTHDKNSLIRYSVSSMVAGLIPPWVITRAARAWKLKIVRATSMKPFFIPVGKSRQHHPNKIGEILTNAIQFSDTQAPVLKSFPEKGYTNSHPSWNFCSSSRSGWMPLRNFVLSIPKCLEPVAPFR